MRNMPLGADTWMHRTGTVGTARTARTQRKLVCHGRRVFSRAELAGEPEHRDAGVV